MADTRYAPVASVIGNLDKALPSLNTMLEKKLAIVTRPAKLDLKGKHGGIDIPAAMWAAAYDPAAPKPKGFPSTYELPAEEKHKGYCHPCAFYQALSARLPPYSVVTIDSGDVSLWAGAAICLDKPGQKVLHSKHMGVMGSAIPAAVGAAAYRSDQVVVALLGDGGFHESSNELGALRSLGARKVCLAFSPRLLSSPHA